MPTPSTSCCSVSPFVSTSAPCEDHPAQREPSDSPYRVASVFLHLFQRPLRCATQRRWRNSQFARPTPIHPATVISSPRSIHSAVPATAMEGPGRPCVPHAASGYSDHTPPQRPLCSLAVETSLGRPVLHPRPPSGTTAGVESSRSPRTWPIRRPG